jgi:hypothetical protein
MNNKEKFLSFCDDLGKYMNDNHPDICFYGYGSCFNFNNESPNDLDGGLICPDIITDKKEILEISGKINSLIKKNEILYQQMNFNLIDTFSGKDGRFLSYHKGYTTNIKKCGKVLSGPNYLNGLNGIDNKCGDLESIAFNFRIIRRDLLISNSTFHEGELIKRFRGACHLLKVFPRAIKCFKILSTNKEDKYSIRSLELSNKSKEGFIKELKKTSKVDLSIFDELNSFENLQFNRMDYFAFGKLFGRIVETYEGLIKEYIENNPPKKVMVETLI